MKQPRPGAPLGSAHAELLELLHGVRMSQQAKQGPPATITGAALEDAAALVQAFLDAGSDVEERSIGFASPLQAVAGAGRLAMVEFLLSRGADPKEKPDTVYSPLSAAAGHGHLDVVRRLVDAIGDLSGETKAVPQAAGHGQTACLTLLLEKGAPLGPHAGHALRVAAWQGRLTSVRILLEAGVDPNQHPDYALDLFGQPVEKPYRPRDAALENGHTAIAAFLDGKLTGKLLAKAEAMQPPERPSLTEGLDRMMSAISGRRTSRSKSGDEEPLAGEARSQAVARIVALVGGGALAGGIDEPARDGWPPLALAAAAGHVEVVDALLQAGAAPDAAGPGDVTPLMEAARWGHAAVVARLLRQGADPNRHAADKETALLAAAGRGSLECVRLLLEAGADPKARVRGRSARGYAFGVHKEEIRRLLERFSS